MTTVVINNTAHQGATFKEITLVVRAKTDPVPGAWHEPEDLMKWIAQHSYVDSVTLLAPGVEP